MREPRAAACALIPPPPSANDSNPSRATGRTLAKGAVFPARDRHPPLLSASASAQELRALDVEKETREAVEEASPRGVLEGEARLLQSEASSSSSSDHHSMPTLSSHWKGFFRLWRHKSMRRLATFPPMGVPKLSRWRTTREGKHASPSNPVDADFPFFKPSWKSFSTAELQAATDSFHPDNIIGKGGYAEVYKGCLADGQLVAVKRLTKGTPEERTSNFLSELGIIVHTNHANIAKLVGFGVEGGMHIVLQLSPHGSLASFIYDSKENLDWGTRYKVAVGTAKGLEYLHEKCQRRIIHRDIKAGNILLADDFEPQICDFGLAKWLPDQWTHHTVSSFEGTFGYLAPEYSMHGIVDEKTDVYAFGVLLLELITGRQALDSCQQSLVIWAKPMLEKNDTRGLLDPLIGDTYDGTQLNRAAYVASLCIQQSSLLRPRMSQVLKLLKGEELGQDQVMVRQQRQLQRTFSEELFDTDEYNATRYLNDLTRHRQVALEF